MDASSKPTSRVVRPGSAQAGKQTAAIAPTDPNEQESVVLLPELEALAR